MSDGFILYEAPSEKGRVFLSASETSPSVSCLLLCRCHCSSADGTLGSLPFSCSPWLDSFINCTVVASDDMRGRRETPRAKRKQCLISSGCHSCSAVSKATQSRDAGHWPSPTSSCLMFTHSHTCACSGQQHSLSQGSLYISDLIQYHMAPTTNNCISIIHSIITLLDWIRWRMDGEMEGLCWPQ